MKHILILLVSIACLSTLCLAASDETSIMTTLQHRYAWIPQTELPIITTNKSEPDRFSAIYEKSELQLLVNYDSTLRGAFWLFKESSSIQLDEDFMWKIRLDLPKDKMVMIKDGCYCYLRPDGVIDRGVMMIMMYRPNGVLEGFSAVNNPNDRTLPNVNITKAEARNICNGVANNFACDNGKGVTMSWPYYYELHPEWAQATIRPDDMNGSYIAYDFTYRLGDEPDLVFDDANEEKTHTLPILNMRVNATTGDIVYVKRDFYKASSASTGLETKKPASKYPAVLVNLNTKETKLGFPVILDRKLAYVPLNTIQALAKGHTVTAKAYAKAFKLDGTELALPSKVLSRKGVLYLPWQSLNSLPGVKAQFDAKLAKLDITTEEVKKAK